MDIGLAFPACPAGLDARAQVQLGPAMLVIRVRGPKRSGCPDISWQGGHGVHLPEYRRLRLVVALIAAARELDDPGAIEALTHYGLARLVLEEAAKAAAAAAAAGDLARIGEARP